MARSAERNLFPISVARGGFLHEQTRGRSVHTVLPLQFAFVRILHLVDDSLIADGGVTLRQLLSRLKPPAFEHRVGLMGRLDAAAWADAGCPVVRFGRRWAWSLAAALPVRAEIRRWGVEVVHAWGDEAAAAAQLAAGDVGPVVVTAITPPRPHRWSRWLSAVRGLWGASLPLVACPSQVARRRAIEAGVPDTRCRVIRPAVDFAAINAARRAGGRTELGIPAEGPVLLTMPPPSRVGGHYDAVWAAALIRQLWPHTRIIIPGVSAEARRLERFAASFNMPDLLILTGDRVPFERLLAVSDLVVTAARGDVPMGGLAWAMAAGVPVVGAAVPAVAEYIADHHNGMLYKPGRPTVLAARIRAALRDRALCRRLADTARGEAYELFGLTRLVEEYQALYHDARTGSLWATSPQCSHGRCR